MCPPTDDHLTIDKPLVGLGFKLPFSPKATVLVSGKSLRDTLPYHNALQEIEAKAQAMGAGNPIGTVDVVPGGYVGRFTNGDVYYAKEIGAHLVIGAIRDEYNALGGAGSVLGLPLTDEMTAPDQVGRYSHFQRGSIYWREDLGAHAVWGTVRDEWARLGWERSDLGYPVRDQYRMRSNQPGTEPYLEWCQFENGFIVGNGSGGMVAPAAEMSPDDLRSFVRSMFDRQFHQSPDNVGLHPPVDFTGVVNFYRGPNGTEPRAVGLRLHGFRDNGLLPDTDFAIDIALSFGFVSPGPTFAEPAYQTLVATLVFLRVIHEGEDDTIIPMLPGEVISGVRGGIGKAFFPDSPDPTHPNVFPGSVFITDVPTGFNSPAGTIDIIGVSLTMAGGLQIFLNPLGPAGGNSTVNWGYLRQLIAQGQIDVLKEQQG